MVRAEEPTRNPTEVMNETPASLDQLNARLDRVNRWIENCDQKVYIMMAFIGACIVVFASSSLFLKARAVLIQPFYAYLNNHEAYSFSLRNLLLLVGLLFICLFAGRMIFFLLKALFPKTITKEFLKENSTLEGDSLMHFQAIANTKFDDFETKAATDSIERYKHDLLSQIYINSKICTDKFEHLKQGLHAMNYLIICVSIEAALAFLLQ